MAPIGFYNSKIVGWLTLVINSLLVINCLYAGAILSISKMSFQEEIKQFNNRKLKHSDTFVTTTSGHRYLENKIAPEKLIVNDSQFFVIDHNPDQQIGEVRKYLCIGSADVTGNQDLLVSLGVTHILNVATINMEYFPDKFIYHNVPLIDIPEENLLDKLEECFKFIDSSRSCDGKVFVHCMAGISRSASVVIAYIMKHYGMTFDEALAEVKECRPSINPNEGFRKQLMTWKP